jgi:translation initiation factor IF-3
MPLVQRGGPLQRPEPKAEKTRINERIREAEVRVIASDGRQLGIMTPEQALVLARQETLDLVEIAPTATPPVVKIMDYGKYKYEVAKKDRLARKKQHSTILKGIRFSPSINEHDLSTKIKMAHKFIEEGAKVKATIIFRGRMITHQEFGIRMMERVATGLADVAKIETPAKMEGPRMMTMMLVKK